VKFLVTGGASGLGKSIVEKLTSNKDSTVYFTYCKSQQTAIELEEKFENTRAYFCDFEELSSFNALLLELESLDIDVLVNNALPKITIKHCYRTSRDEIEKSFCLNVVPTIELTKTVFRKFRKQKSGKIITILTSYLVNRPPIGLSEYVANKAYLLSMARSWAVEGVRNNITSNCISPSMMETSLIDSIDERQVEAFLEEQPGKRFVSTHEVAAAVEYFSLSGSHVNGVNMPMNGGVDVI